MKRVLSFLLLIAAVLILWPQRGQALEAPVINSKFAILVETTSGSVLYEKDAHERAYPASLTKIMTALLALEALDMDAMVTVSETALQNLHVNGSTANLVEGEQISVRDLLYCVMLSSANEGCNVIAEAVSGSVDAFVNLMNERAREIGCQGTHFANTHGLHDENHYTTAYDMYLISMEARKLPLFLEIVHTESYEVKPTNKTPESRILKTTNGLIAQQAKSQYYYAPAKGIKTGFTTPAGYCLVSLATKNAMELLCVVMGGGQAEDGKTENFTETVTLYNWGFNNFTRKTLVAKGTPILAQNVVAGKDADEINLVTQEGLEMIVPDDYDVEALTFIPYVDEFAGTRSKDGVLMAPIDKGMVLGNVDIRDGDTLIATIQLVTDVRIERSEEAFVGYTISNLYNSAKLWIWGGLALLVLLILAYVIYAINHNKKRRARGYRGRRR